MVINETTHGLKGKLLFWNMSRGQRRVWDMYVILDHLEILKMQSRIGEMNLEGKDWGLDINGNFF